MSSDLGLVKVWERERCTNTGHGRDAESYGKIGECHRKDYWNAGYKVQLGKMGRSVKCSTRSG